MRPTLDQYFTQMATLVATRSTCLRRSVGCVLVNARGHVLATGYNGVAKGLPHCNEEKVLRIIHPDTPAWLLHNLKEGKEYSDEYLYAHRVHIERTHPHACSGARAESGTNLDGCGAIHAEQNALLQCRDVWAIETCYATTLPCLTCAKLLLNTSCQRIVYLEEYPHAEAVTTLWRSAGRSIERFGRP